MASKNAKSGIGVGTTVGAIAAAAAAAGAGYYFYASKNAPKHRKVAAKWADQMKKEVVTQAKKVKKLDAKTLGRIVDTAAVAYNQVKSVNPMDVMRAASELKRNYTAIKQELQAIQSTVRASVKGSAPSRRSVKKSVKTAKATKTTKAKKGSR